MEERADFEVRSFEVSGFRSRFKVSGFKVLRFGPDGFPEAENRKPEPQPAYRVTQNLEPRNPET